MQVGCCEMDKILLGAVIGFFMCAWALDEAPMHAIKVLATKTSTALNSAE